MKKGIEGIQQSHALPLVQIKGCKHLNVWKKNCWLFFGRWLYLSNIRLKVRMASGRRCGKKVLRSHTFWRKVPPDTSRDNRSTSDSDTTDVIFIFFSQMQSILPKSWSKNCKKWTSGWRTNILTHSCMASTLNTN